MSPVLLAALGAVAGAGLIVCIAWASHIACKKVYSARVLRNITGLRILCSVPGLKKRFVFDRWLRKIEGRAQKTDCVAAVATVIKSQSTGKLLVIGQSTDAQRESFLQALKNEGVEYVSHTGLPTETEFIQDLQGCDTVVLAETCGLSTYDQVRKIIEYTNDFKKPLLGCVLIDG